MFQNTARELSYAWSKLYAQARVITPSLTPHQFSQQLMAEAEAQVATVLPDAAARQALHDAGQAALRKGGA